MAKQIINSERISQVDFINGRTGQYRAIVKVQAGFMTVVNDIGIENNWGKQQWNCAMDVFRNFKKGALQTIEFCPVHSLGLQIEKICGPARLTNELKRFLIMLLIVLIETICSTYF